jgi:hypothetical protein
MLAYDTTIGSRHFALRHCVLRKNGSSKPSSEYQAGFEAGFIVGREAGLKEAEAGKAPVAQLTAAKNNVTVSLRPGVASDHFLLGLPCRTCGAYYASDQEICPACKASKTDTLETRTE